MPATSPNSSLERASSLWRELLDGKWLLLDQFQIDGRRFFIASRPPSNTASPPRDLKAAWMRARGASLKEIAFDLNMSTSGAFCAIKRGCKRLGVASPDELLRFA